MIIIKSNTEKTYFFPVSEAFSGSSVTLELYSELTHETTEITASTDTTVSSQIYAPVILTQAMIDGMEDGEYNYVLSSGTDKLSIGLLRVDIKGLAVYASDESVTTFDADTEFATYSPEP